MEFKNNFLAECCIAVALASSIVTVAAVDVSTKRSRKRKLEKNVAYTEGYIDGISDGWAIFGIHKQEKKDSKKESK